MARHPITEVSQDRLLRLGKELAASGEKWHPHVLSPDCQLNDRRPHCGLILEASDQSEVFATYSEEPMMETARSLAALAHGEDALLADPGDVKPKSTQVAEMMRRAKTLSGRGKHWHHHVLFPECIFNTHPGKWTIVFEDPDTGEMLESVTRDRPAQDIQVTETMFFAQSVHRQRNQK